MGMGSLPSNRSPKRERNYREMLALDLEINPGENCDGRWENLVETIELAHGANQCILRGRRAVQLPPAE